MSQLKPIAYLYWPPQFARSSLSLPVVPNFATKKEKKKRIVMCTVDLETVCDIRRKEVSGKTVFCENGKFRLSILELIIGIARIVSPLAFRSQGGIRPEVANSPTETVDPGT